MRLLKVGIIGCGAISSVHLDAITALETAELVMVCDSDKAAAMKVAKATDCRWTSDYQVLLNEAEIELVHILTPHFLHVPMAIEALKAGKHVVLEKPVGISFESLKQLQEFADQSEKTVGVTLQNRFNPTTVEMLAIIKSGRLGPLVGAKGLVTWSRSGDYYRLSPWRGQKRYEGGGLLINQAIHTLDLMAYVGGPIKTIKATVANNTHPDLDVEDTVMAMMTYDNGAVGNFYGSNSHGTNSDVELEFVFENGLLRLLNQKLYVTLDGQTQVVASDLVKKGEKAYWGMSHQLIIDDIYQSIIEGKAPRVTLKDAIEATRLVLGCYEAGNSGLTYEV